MGDDNTVAVHCLWGAQQAEGGGMGTHPPISQGSGVGGS